jgi:hypothetical protein
MKKYNCNKKINKKKIKNLPILLLLEGLKIKPMKQTVFRAIMKKKRVLLEKKNRNKI